MIQPQNDDSFWFVVQLGGILYQFENSDTANSLTEVLDISAQVSSGGEFGLTGAAFHPNYPSDNRIFLLYNDANNEGRSTLSSFTVNTTTRAIDETSETTILTLDQPTTTHNGGDLAFGTDGYLYASFGDSNYRDRAQETTNLYGTLIRIDINTSPYGIPNDNPLTNEGQSRCDSTANSTGQVCREIFAFGFRNPWRFSIDSATGTPWVGDVGELTYEEIDRVIAGGNYGWPITEAYSCFGDNPCDLNAYEAPVTQYGRSDGISILGGYVYRGTQSPNLIGTYLFGDTGLNRFYSVDSEAPTGTPPNSLFTGYQAYGMAQGNDGEVYILRSCTSGCATGELVYRIEDGSAVTYTMPDNLSETGCFNVGTKTSPDGVVDYDNINPLWSDGAEKQRSLAIPDGTTIDVANDGEFQLPSNTVLVKHFLANTTYIETRLLVRHPGGWQGYSYEWNDAETEAVLLPNSPSTKNVGDFVHTFPSRSQCNQCHIGSDASLGVEALQLNRDYTPFGMNIIDYMNAAGYFTENQASSSLPRLTSLDDTSATLEERARSYLHSNCSGCHRPDAGNRVDIDFRYSTSLTNANICDVDPALSNLGVSNAKLVAPGNPDASIVLLRMETSGDQRMPPLARLLEDTDATQVVRDWISGLSSCE